MRSQSRSQMQPIAPITALLCSCLSSWVTGVSTSMALSKPKKRKIDSENRQFQSEWTDKYLFILPAVTSTKPVCLLCNECMSVMKEYNLKRHYKSNHGSFSARFPEGSDERRSKIQRLLASFQHGQAALGRFCTEQERAMIASLRVAWTLTRQKRPFTEAETVKDCMLAVIDEVVVDEKVRESVTSSIKKVPLSDTSTLRRVELLAKDVSRQLLDNLKKTDVMSIAVDESTDCTDMAQLCIYVRFHDGVHFREELVGLIPMEGHTTGEAIFQKIDAFFDERELDLQKVCLLVTDGAPAMIGRLQGLTARLSTIAPHMQFLHCIIHQSVLCAKLSGDLKNTMDTVMNIVNFIRSTSSLQHRLFRMMLADMFAEHTDLLVHNDVRWLSKGNVLDRFCELHLEIVSFLRVCKHKRAANLLERMLDEQFMAEVYFLCDIFKHLNTLNLELQGREKSIADLVEKLCAFKTKLTIFTTDLSATGLLHFPRLRGFMNTAPEARITPVMTDFMTKLTENFTERFQGFNIPIEVLHFARDPFSIKPEADFCAKVKEVMSSIDESIFQLEMVDVQSSFASKQYLQS
uniref:DUF4371 domain-containing protein n=1 Tax=Sparus aurata TaxID=8175 RepID=A0A671WXQ4_SPAAU